MLYKRYQGSFLSRAGIVWLCEIWQDSPLPFPSGELTFEAEEPLLIEWPETEKEEPVCGSSVTLRLESPGDRTYFDLHAAGSQAVQLRVYRNKKLYWSGLLDTEFYEEPYERARLYPVSLTFTDFGILDRLKYNRRGVVSLQSIVDECISRARIQTTGLSEGYLLYLEDGKTGVTLDNLYISSENFYNEDGEAMSLREALEGILQPLALRLVQRAGTIYVYDLNSLYLYGDRRIIQWAGDSQTLSVDRTLNNIRINFSAYAKSDALSNEVTFEGDYTGAENSPADCPDGTTFYAFAQSLVMTEELKNGQKNRKWQPDIYTQGDFRVYLSQKGKGVQKLHPGAKYARILPYLNNAPETDCILWRLIANNDHTTNIFPGDRPSATITGLNGVIHPPLATDEQPANLTLFETEGIYIPPVGDWDSSDFALRLTMEILADPRYNPYVDAVPAELPWAAYYNKLSGTQFIRADNESELYNGVKVRTGTTYIRVGIGLYDAAGKPLYHHENWGYGQQNVIDNLFYGGGRWLPGAPSYDKCTWLEYRVTDGDRKTDTGILGWKKNVWLRNGEFNLVSDMKVPGTVQDGETISYPPCEGYLRIEVYNGIYCYDFEEFANLGLDKDDCPTPYHLNPGVWIRQGYYERLRWLAYKAPVVEILSGKSRNKRADLDDVEYTGHVNPDAQEELSIDTIVGTHTEISPAARGVLLTNAGGQLRQLQRLTRADVTDHPENLLIGTLCSQYAVRRVMLTGESSITPEGLCRFTEANQPDKVFMLRGERQDAITDCSEAVYVEFVADEFKSSSTTP